MNRQTFHIREAGTLSSGTLATLTGKTRYDELDEIRNTWIARIEQNAIACYTWRNWRECWAELMPEWKEA